MDLSTIPQAFDNPYEPQPANNAERRRRRKEYVRDVGTARAQAQSHVYFIEGGGLIKIGIAFDIGLRFKQLSDMSPVPLRLAAWFKNGGRHLEQKLHKKLKAHRRHGEWFAITWPEIKAAWKELSA